MPVPSAQLSLLLQEEDARSRGATGQTREQIMLNHGSHIHFSVPPTKNNSHKSNGKSPVSAERNGRSQRGLLEAWLEHGKEERFVAERIPINPERAEALLRLNTHNRNLKPTVVDQYAHIMRCGQWRHTIEALGVDRNGVLLNGQHRLEAVKKANVTVEFDIWFGVDPEDFKVIDQGSKRGAADLVQINGHSNEKTRAPAVKILLIIESGDGKYRPAPQFVSDRVDELGSKFDRATYWGEKLKRGKNGKITTSTAGAVAYFMIQESGTPYEKIENFFTMLLNGRDDEVVTPKEIIDLRDQLKTGALSEGHDTSSNIKRAAAIIQIWNKLGKEPKTTKDKKTTTKAKTRTPQISWNSSSSLPVANP